MVQQGYEKLATIGVLYRGEYVPDPEPEYKFMHAVYWMGSTYISLIDNPQGEPTDDKVNWQFMAKGFVDGMLEAINANDPVGLLGIPGEVVNAQTLINNIADRVMNQLVRKTKILNTLEEVSATTDPFNVTGALATSELAKRTTRYYDNSTMPFTVFRVGFVVEIAILRNKIPFSSGTDYVLANISLEYRPSNNYQSMISIDRTGGVAYVYVTTEGEVGIRAYTNVAANEYTFNRLVYTTAN